jgi:hypothetical protein
LQGMYLTSGEESINEKFQWKDWSIKKTVTAKSSIGQE